MTEMVSTTLLQWTDEQPPSLPSEVPVDDQDTRSVCLDLLSEVEGLGMALVLKNGRPTLMRNGLSVPPDIVARLTRYRAPLLAYLAGSKRNADQTEARKAEIVARPLPAIGTSKPEWWEADYPGHPRPDPATLPWVTIGASSTPPSWYDPSGMRVPAGARCYCCRGQRWWRRDGEANGWCCFICHPPVPGAAIEVQNSGV